MINMQSALCGICKNRNVITRCNREHMMEVHHVNVDIVYEINSKIADFIKEGKEKRKKMGKDKTASLKRKEVMDFADSLIRSCMERIKSCTNNNWSASDRGT